MRPCIIFNFDSFKNVIRPINFVQAGVYHAYIREKRIKINIMAMKGQGGGARPTNIYAQLMITDCFIFKI